MATYDISSTIPSSFYKGDILNCPYTGGFKKISLPKGTYMLECWGAQGGDTSYCDGGKGGYSSGQITLTKTSSLYLYTGGKGQPISRSNNYAVGGFNGGGESYSDGSSIQSCSGGGASDIRINTNSFYARVIVAGGGGGAFQYSSYEAFGGSGGGDTGNAGDATLWGRNKGGEGGTQNSGGKSYQGSSENPSVGTLASFGKGGYVDLRTNFSGGGGGWYGGGFSRWAAAGRRSGYVYNSSTSANYPSGCLLNSSHLLTSSYTYNGSNSSFLSPSGSTEQGHSRDGYIRITIIDLETEQPPTPPQSQFDLFLKINGSQKKGESMMIKFNNSWKKREKIYVKINGVWK